MPVRISIDSLISAAWYWIVSLLISHQLLALKHIMQDKALSPSAPYLATVAWDLLAASGLFRA
jgi:hypothetical protein